MLMEGWLCDRFLVFVNEMIIFFVFVALALFGDGKPWLSIGHFFLNSSRNSGGKPQEGVTLSSHSLWHLYLHSLHLRPVPKIGLLQYQQVAITLKVFVKRCAIWWPMPRTTVGVRGDLGTWRLVAKKKKITSNFQKRKLLITFATVIVAISAGAVVRRRFNWTGQYRTIVTGHCFRSWFRWKSRPSSYGSMMLRTKQKKNKKTSVRNIVFYNLLSGVHIAVVGFRCSQLRFVWFTFC